jgi:hypothetical protein
VRSATEQKTVGKIQIDSKNIDEKTGQTKKRSQTRKNGVKRMNAAGEEDEYR